MYFKTTQPSYQDVDMDTDSDNESLVSSNLFAPTSEPKKVPMHVIQNPELLITPNFDLLPTLYDESLYKGVRK